MKSMFVSSIFKDRCSRSAYIFLAMILLAVPMMITCVPAKGFCQPQDLTADFISEPPDGWYVQFTDQSLPTIYWYVGT